MDEEWIEQALNAMFASGTKCWQLPLDQLAVLVIRRSPSLKGRDPGLLVPVVFRVMKTHFQGFR